MRRKAAWILAAVMLVSAATRVRASDRQKYLALTFDDGPTEAVTEALLDGLAERDVKATFFVCGYRAAQLPDTLCRMAEEGHEIGLHSCNHTIMNKLTKDEALFDLTECRLQVTEICGVAPRLFRPPGGGYCDETLAAAEELGLSVILWSVDPRDWDETAYANVLPAVLQNAAPGRIVLMHDLSEHSVDCALAAIDRLQAEGFTFCTVSELAAAYDTALLPGQVYRSFGNG